jgi:hypothetical protein
MKPVIVIVDGGCVGEDDERKGMWYYLMYGADGRHITNKHGDVPFICRVKVMAKYHALICALEDAIQFAFSDYPVVVQLNERSIINQIQGKWAPKVKYLVPLYHKAIALINGFSNITFKLVDKDYFGELIEKLEKKK